MLIPGKFTEHFANSITFSITMITISGRNLSKNQTKNRKTFKRQLGKTSCVSSHPYKSSQFKNKWRTPLKWQLSGYNWWKFLLYNYIYIYYYFVLCTWEFPIWPTFERHFRLCTPEKWDTLMFTSTGQTTSRLSNRVLCEVYKLTYW